MGTLKVYFAGRLVTTTLVDRLGSVRTTPYYPYGEEYTTTTENQEKFATYFRDGTTALDYARNRYYSSTLGRFLTADPYRNSAGPGDPGSWNRYAYAGNDPVNLYDPTGLDSVCPTGLCAIISLPPPGSQGRGSGGGGGISSGGPALEVPPDFQTGHGGTGNRNIGRIIQELQAAINLAFKALANPKCSGLFGLTPGSANPSYLLQQLEKGTSGYGYFTIGPIPAKKDTVTSATTTPLQTAVDIGYGNATQLTTTGVDITINNRAGSFVSGTPVDQAITVLHELGHAFDDIFGVGASKIVPDGETVPDHLKVSEANTALIKKDCFK